MGLDGETGAGVHRGRLSAAPVDPIAQLRQLGELRDAGILTDVEFTTKKAEILSRL
ncbi:SHOCT domain-containing protein [Micromonospora sp. CPCC 205558]|uniref:SHOCT domain-containing protein n=1 Tax=Micromonospora sp. CPCC 205558 TaxID=3122403 RepID=UPI003FA5374B